MLLCYSIGEYFGSSIYLSSPREDELSKETEKIAESEGQGVSSCTTYESETHRYSSFTSTIRLLYTVQRLQLMNDCLADIAYQCFNFEGRRKIIQA
jgi:uncharacterized tellurite resistance protein B-like protein